MSTTAAPSVDPLQAVEVALARHVDEPGGLLPVLHDVQHALGCVPAEVVPVIAKAMNLSRAEVHGVITFYQHFRSAPAGGHVVQICRAEACQAMGAEALLSHAQQRLGCAGSATSADGRFTVEPVYCLGLCASSPAMRIDDQPHARVSIARFDRLVGALEAELDAVRDSAQDSGATTGER